MTEKFTKERLLSAGPFSVWRGLPNFTWYAESMSQAGKVAYESVRRGDHFSFAQTRVWKDAEVAGKVEDNPLFLHVADRWIQLPISAGLDTIVNNFLRFFKPTRLEL